MKVRRIHKPVPMATLRQQFRRTLDLSRYVMRDAVTGEVYAADDPRWLYGIEQKWTPTGPQTFVIKLTQEK